MTAFGDISFYLYIYRCLKNNNKCHEWQIKIFHTHPTTLKREWERERYLIGGGWMLTSYHTRTILFTFNVCLCVPWISFQNRAKKAAQWRECDRQCWRETSIFVIFVVLLIFKIRFMSFTLLNVAYSLHVFLQWRLCAVQKIVHCVSAVCCHVKQEKETFYPQTLPALLIECQQFCAYSRFN